jgi:hypothetical protein
MGRIRLPPDVKLFCGLLFADETAASEAGSRLVDAFGPVDYASPVLPFDYTHYYERELGEPVRRQFLAFERLVGRERLADIKIETNRIERDLSRREGERICRRVNLDPGYVSDAHLCLATTKGSAHRIYLGNGIYGDIELHFRRRSIDVMPWTYPDYRTEAYHAVFKEIRAIYVARQRAPASEGKHRV